MTTIIGVQHQYGFVVAADQQVTCEDRAYIHSDVMKIVKNNGYVIAGAGNSRYCDVILYDWKPPSYDGSTIYNFMVSKFIPEMRKAHENTGYVLKDNESFEFIVGLKNRLYYVGEDYSVIRTNTGIYGIGTGSSYAVGAVAAGADIKTAMKVADKFDVNTGGRIQIVKQGVLDA
jgi:ATP-dependent protease HslVU (ClpYQ) peptidase subunit